MFSASSSGGGERGEVHLYIGYMGMCRWREYGVKPFGLVKGMVFKPFGLVKGMVFKPFGLVKGIVIIQNWSSIGSRLTGSLTKN